MFCLTFVTFPQCVLNVYNWYIYSLMGFKVQDLQSLIYQNVISADFTSLPADYSFNSKSEHYVLLKVQLVMYPLNAWPKKQVECWRFEFASNNSALKGEWAGVCRGGYSSKCGGGVGVSLCHLTDLSCKICKAVCPLCTSCCICCCHLNDAILNKMHFYGIQVTENVIFFHRCYINTFTSLSLMFLKMVKKTHWLHTQNFEVR